MKKLIIFLAIVLYAQNIEKIFIDVNKKITIPKPKSDFILKDYSFYGSYKVKPFYIGKYEISIKEYNNYLKFNHKKLINAEYPDEPITFVDFDTAQKVCKFYKGRLPTELEWIVASSIKINDSKCFKSLKKGKFYRYAIGKYPLSYKDDILKCFLKIDDEVEPSLIGSEKNDVEYSYENINGTYGMFGNVWEWVNRDVTYNKKHYKVIKGGSYANFNQNALYDNRVSNFLNPMEKRDNVGFRCVWEKK